MCKHAYRLLIRKTYVQNIIAVALSLCSFTYGAHLGVLIKACKVSNLKLHICRYVNRKFFKTEKKKKCIREGTAVVGVDPPRWHLFLLIITKIHLK